MAAFSLSTIAAIRGYHVYKDSWEPSVGDLKRYNGELETLESAIFLLPTTNMGKWRHTTRNYKTAKFSKNYKKTVTFVSTAGK